MILVDGPMGTELERRGVATPAPGWSAYALAAAPETVRAIHADYARARAMVHRTNTFRAQPHLFGAGHRELVARAVRIAREACGAARLAGSLGPVADCYRPDLAPPSAEARAVHEPMARALVAEGIDLLFAETFPHAGEARVAVEACVATGAETWVSLTAGPDGSLMTPQEMARGAKDCIDAGAAAVLVGCTDARLVLPYVSHLARVAPRCGATANAGAGISPEEVAALVATWRAAGASIVGGCCYMGPEHVARLAEPRVREVVDAQALAAARALVEAHAAALGDLPGAKAIYADAAALPGPYAGPRGAFWLAWVDGAPVGSIAMKSLSDSVAEIKRMFVQPAFRGQGLARALLDRAILAARTRGFRALRLGTRPEMQAARSLYEQTGFVPVAPYREVELGGDTIFYELALDP